MYLGWLCGADDAALCQTGADDAALCQTDADDAALCQTGADDAALRASAALELLHAFALLQDDVMDDSGLRRGRPAAHLQFGQWHRDRGLSGRPPGSGLRWRSCWAISAWSGLSR